MALFTPSQSPAVVVKEVDLTGGVPNVQTSTGAIAGNFRWGPVEERVLISNEQNFVGFFVPSSMALIIQIDSFQIFGMPIWLFFYQPIIY